jgi:hypothetical protein
MTSDLTDALSVDRTREQFNDLVARFHGPSDLFTPEQWRRIVTHSGRDHFSTPLTIAKENRLQAFWTAIRAEPVKGSPWSSGWTSSRFPRTDSGMVLTVGVAALITTCP